MSNVFKKFLKGDPVGLMKQGGDSLGRRVLGEKTFGRLNKFDPLGAQYESFGHDASLGDNILSGESIPDSFRQRGREDMLGLRAREVGAGALMAVGGYYAAPYLAGGSGVGYGGTTSASAAPSASAGSANPLATQMGYSGSTVGSGTSAASSSWQDYARQQPPQQQGGSEYQQEDYDNSAYNDQLQYWTGRAMELREMADAAVRKYYT